jgi:hypothetical protein
MKRKTISIVMAAALLITMGLATTLPVGAATEEDIQTAIDKGIEYLVAQQDLGTGQFIGEYGELAETSFAVLKLLDRAYETGKDPFQTDIGAPDYYMYHDNVVKGLDYIFLQAGTYGLGTGICFPMWSETYNTGIAMLAIAASQTPDRVVVSANAVVNGLTYQQVVQGCVDYFVFAQNPDGAWRYWYTDEPSDNSNTGYATLGLRGAEEFGCTVPQAVKDNLSPWLDFIQDDVNGDTDDGGSWYTDGWSWVNLLKTGNLLFEFAYVGDTVGVGRVDDAVDYIERHWNDPNGDPGWQDNYQAMYCLMKGFVAQNIEEIEVAGSPVDWFDEIADHILATQNADGSWPWDYWGGPLLATEWALLTLEKVAPPPPVIRVTVDVKPMSWPNPLNVKSKGVLPVAILGTEDFDVSQIDPATILLEGVAPLRWALEDVGTPGDPLAGPDGFTDLTLKFRSQEIVAALGPVNDGDVLALHLTGNLKEEHSGTPIEGEDVVRIIKKN